MSLQVDILQTESRKETILLMLLVVVFSLISVGFIILFLNVNGYNIKPWDLIKFGFLGVVFRDPDAPLFDLEINSQDLSLIVFWAIPLALTALAVAISFHAGLFNIGGQGQMMIGGAFAGIWASVIVPDIIVPKLGIQFLIQTDPNFGSQFLMILSTILAGMLGGAFWAFIPGILKAKTGAHEVITTILMNLTAILYATYLVGKSYSPYRDQSSSGGDQRAQTPQITESARIPVVDKDLSTFLNYSFIVVIIVIILLWFMIYRTTFGFQLRAVGFNQTAAETSGVNADRMIIYALTLSGALAGLAGALIVQSPISNHRFKIDSIGTTGFDGIAISLIGLNNPIGIGIAALFFGFLAQSRIAIDGSTDIPPDLIFVFQSFIILFAAAPLIGKKLIDRLKRLQEQDKSDSQENSDNSEGGEIVNGDESQ